MQRGSECKQWKAKNDSVGRTTLHRRYLFLVLIYPTIVLTLHDLRGPKVPRSSNPQSDSHPMSGRSRSSHLVRLSLMTIGLVLSIFLLFEAFGRSFIPTILPLRQQVFDSYHSVWRRHTKPASPPVPMLSDYLRFVEMQLPRIEELVDITVDVPALVMQLKRVEMATSDLATLVRWSDVPVSQQLFRSLRQTVEEVRVMGPRLSRFSTIVDSAVNLYVITIHVSFECFPHTICTVFSKTIYRLSELFNRPFTSRRMHTLSVSGLSSHAITSAPCPQSPPRSIEFSDRATWLYSPSMRSNHICQPSTHCHRGRLCITQQETRLWLCSGTDYGPNKKVRQKGIVESNICGTLRHM